MIKHDRGAVAGNRSRDKTKLGPAHRRREAAGIGAETRHGRYSNDTLAHHGRTRKVVGPSVQPLSPCRGAQPFLGSCHGVVS